MTIQTPPSPNKIRQILSLFQAMPLGEKKVVVAILNEALTTAAPAPPLSPLARVLQAQKPPIITDISQLAADLGEDAFEGFDEWLEQERALNKQLSEERFQRLFGEDLYDPVA